MPKPVKRENAIFSIFGRKGSGKSYLVRQIMAEYPKIVVLDTLGEYGSEKEVVTDAREAVRKIHSLANSDKRVWTVSVRLDRVTDYLPILGFLYHVPGILVVIEEVSLYTSPQSIPEEISRLVRYGRHKDISLIFVSRRPAEIHRDLSAQSDVIVSFVQHEPRDVSYFRALLGPAAKGVQSLKRYELIAGGNPDKFPRVVKERLKLQGAQLEMFDT